MDVFHRISNRRRRAVAAATAAVVVLLAVAGPTPAGAAEEPPSRVETRDRVGSPDFELGASAGTDARRKGRPSADTSGAFIYRKGRYTPLAPIPGAAQAPSIPGTRLEVHFANNDRGQVAGSFADAPPGPDGLAPPGSFHGFVKDRRGRVTRFDVPGAAELIVKGLNNRGQVVGSYLDFGATRGPDGLYPPNAVHGFIRDRDGRITTFDVPFPYLHDIGDINDRGQIVGYYDDPDRPYNLPGGFLRQADGKIVPIEVPGALSTDPRCINNRGQVVGSYVDAGAEPNPDGTIPQGVIHGFVWDNGRYTTFDPKGSVYTVAGGCNDRGQISGGYQDATGKEHGFVLSRGRTTTLDAPGRIDNVAWGINNRGEIVIPEATLRLGAQVGTS